jgi:late competence protein required for DNA uptake (superfamily II DNA/RNA helicase)
MPRSDAEVRLESQRRFAWAMYYQEARRAHERTVLYVNRQAAMLTDPTLPTHLKNEIEEMRAAARKDYECPICMDMIPSGQLDITNCGHFYCKECLAQLLRQADPKCAICRKKLAHRD